MADDIFEQGLNGRLVFAIVAAAFGSAFQHGYNTGVVNAPQTLIEDFINQTYHRRTAGYATVTFTTAVFSVFVSIYACGGMVGAMATGVLAERFGRRGGLLINNALVIVSAVLLGLSKMADSYEMLIVGRFVVGINSGLNAGLAPMYLTEISPVRFRGAIGTIYQLIITISILLSQVFGLPQIFGTAELWPVLFGLIIVPCIAMFVLLPFCPESPKYILIKKEKEDEAEKALAWFWGAEDVNAEMDLLKAEYEVMKSVPKVTLKEMMVNLALRKPLIISVVIMLSQQFSGINAVIFYSTGIFKKTGLTQQNAIHATIGMGAINVLMTIVSLVLVEIAGRKTLHLIGLGGMAIITLLLTISLAFTHKAPDLKYFSIVCIISFIIMFASGPGSIPWFLVSELFQQGPRASATSIAVAVNWFANFIVGIAFLSIQQQLHEYTFLVFTALLVIFFVFTLIEVPETKGRTIDDITAEFQKQAESSILE